MTCECGGKFVVTDSYTENQKVYRRRKCDTCGEPMFTIEMETARSSKVKQMLNSKPRRC